MANTFSKDKMAVLFEEMTEQTSINMTLSKDLEVYGMSDLADMGRTTDSAGSGADTEWIPQEYRFTVQDGIESSASDYQDLIDRNIPIRRNKSKRILTKIGVKDLRDAYRLERAKKAMAKQIATEVDLIAYETMRDRANMTLKLTGDFSYDDAILAESMMLNAGLGSYDKKLLLSIPHYNKVAQALQTASREVAVMDALSRAKIPNLSTFATMRADYTSKLAASTGTGLTVNGDQSHTVATYDASNEFYLDNRQMTLAVTGITTANAPKGTRFTIAGINALHPETKSDTGELLTFTVVTAGNGSAVVSPAIVTTGPYANASDIANTGAAVTVLNTVADAASLFYTPESTVLIPGTLPVPADIDGVTVFNGQTENGLPMRMSMWYDGHDEALIIKTLIYFDVAVIQPEQMGIIIANQS